VAENSLINFLRRREVLLAIAGILVLLLLVKSGWSYYQARNQTLDDEITLKTLQYQKYSRLVARRQEFVELNQALSKFQQEVETRYLSPEMMHASLDFGKDQLISDECEINTLVNHKIFTYYLMGWQTGY